ncbi:MAG: hypothetical protein ACTHU0_21570 [Kofleriaceae bacterium]
MAEIDRAWETVREDLAAELVQVEVEARRLRRRSEQLRAQLLQHLNDGDRIELPGGVVSMCVAHLRGEGEVLAVVRRDAIRVTLPGQRKRHSGTERGSCDR